MIELYKIAVGQYFKLPGNKNIFIRLAQDPMDMPFINRGDKDWNVRVRMAFSEGRELLESQTRKVQWDSYTIVIPYGQQGKLFLF